MSGQSGGHRLRLAKLNEQLTCKLCSGYFIDATTIIECLHSFCRSCIVKYLESNKYCPICEVQVHKSKPLLNIRPDHTLQDIVYKLVPGCYQNEMRCRREFYTKHPEARASAFSPEARGEPTESHIYSPDESLSLSLEYYNPSLKEDSGDAKQSTAKALPRRYLRCPAAVTIFHLQKLIRAKYGLTEAHRVDIMYKEEPLFDSYTLMDVMYIYHWRRKVPLHLSYRIFESSSKRLKLSEDNIDFKQSLSDAGISSLDLNEEQSTKREWKEVQLKISETGVMSVTDISSPDGKKGTKIDDASEQKQSVETITAAETVIKSEIVLRATKQDAEAVKSETEPIKSISVAETETMKSSKPLISTTDSNKGSVPQDSASTGITGTTSDGAPNDPGTKNSTKSQADVQSAVKIQMEKQKETGTLKSGETDKTVTTEENKSQGQKAVPQPAKSGTSSHPSDTKNVECKQTITNNNFINAETKADNQKQSAKSASDVRNPVTSAGSKIDALSAKLQFQPKVGQVNNTYSKKAPKEKKSTLIGAKKVDSKASTEGAKDPSKENPLDSVNLKARTNCEIFPIKPTTAPTTVEMSQSNSPITSTQTTSTFVTAPQTSCFFVSSSASATYVTAPSVSISNVQNSSSIDRSSSHCTHSTSISAQQALSSPGKKINSSDQIVTGSSQKPVPTSQVTSSLSQKLPYVANNSLPPTSQNLASIGLNVSTAMLNLSQPSPNFPYTVEHLVNNTMLKNSKNSSAPSGQKQASVPQNSSTAVTCPSTESSQSSCAAHFSMQTTSMSIYSMSTSARNNTYTNASSHGTTSSSKQLTPKANFEMSSGAYSIPPCPDAIPISLMKPTIRKHEVIAKGTNLNEICAKIGTSGSKINDICAKIGENSKEKSKAETRNRSEIPDLLKIARKSPATAEPVMKHIPNIPNVPIYTPSNNLAAATENKCTYPSKETAKTVSSSVTSQASSIASHNAQKIASHKKQTQPVGYKTLRDPPKSWNPTLSKNNYVAVKNQAKEMQSQTQVASTSDGGNSKQIASKPAKIFKMKNMPRYLGNPASGVKPMYGISNDAKEKEHSPGGTKNATMSMVQQIDPKTLSPIVSTTNSPIVSPPPYSPNARSYQNTPFPRDMCRNSGSPMSPRNSPVNMLSTNPFIPSPTPNTNPRLIYPHHFPPSYLSNPLIRSPIGVPPPSAFHSRLPQINKLYQRSSYMPQTTSYSPTITQPPAVQRIPPSTHSSPKSPKTSSSSTSSMFNLAKTETQTSIPTSVESIALHLAKNAAHQELNAFNLSKTGSQSSAASATVEGSKTSSTDLSGTQGKQQSQSTTSSGSSSTSQSQQSSATTSVSKAKVQCSPKTTGDDKVKQKTKEEETRQSAERSKADVQSSKGGVTESDRKFDSKDVAKESEKKKEKSPPKINGDVTSNADISRKEVDSEAVGKLSENSVKPVSKEQGNASHAEKTSESKESGNANDAVQCEAKGEGLGKAAEQIQGKKSDAQRNKAES